MYFQYILPIDSPKPSPSHVPSHPFLWRDIIHSPTHIQLKLKTKQIKVAIIKRASNQEESQLNETVPK